jgi:NADH-quinone oxidoreductase subunit M
MALAFSTESPQVLAALIAVSSVIFLVEHRETGRMVRVSGAYLAFSGTLFVAGAALLWFGETWEDAGLWLIVGGLLVRKGIAPVHSWMPESFERGHLVPALLFNAPQVGTYAAAVVVLPSAPHGALTVIAVAALVTTVYGAILAVVESDTRRAFGYLFMSQSALVLVGLGSGREDGVAGSLAVWVAAGLSMTGLGLTIAALELRRGRLSLRDHHGGYEQMPLLAASFLVFGLASVGFPGTLGFLGEELLIAGSVERFTWVGFAVVAATAVNGITVLKMYFSLFCGRADGGIALPLRSRETIAFAALAIVLVAGGLFPRNLVESRVEAAQAIVAANDGRGDSIAAGIR